MTHGLFQHAVAGINQNNRQISGRSACYHIARVLNMSRCVGDDELAARRGEVAVCYIDSYALFAFCTQTVCQQGEVQLFVTSVARGHFDCFQLIFEDRLAVVEQSADQCAFAVVNTSGRSEAQQFHIQISFFHSFVLVKNTRLSCGPP